MGSSSGPEDFSVLVLASDLGVDARPFLTQSDRDNEEERWHDCPSYLDEDFSDLEALQFFRLERGFDKAGNRIFRIVGKYFPGMYACLQMYSSLTLNCFYSFLYGYGLNYWEYFADA